MAHSKLKRKLTFTVSGALLLAGSTLASGCEQKPKEPGVETNRTVNPEPQPREPEVDPTAVKPEVDPTAVKPEVDPTAVKPGTENEEPKTKVPPDFGHRSVNPGPSDPDAPKPRSPEETEPPTPEVTDDKTISGSIDDGKPHTNKKVNPKVEPKVEPKVVPPPEPKRVNTIPTRP